MELEKWQDREDLEGTEGGGKHEQNILYEKNLYFQFKIKKNH